MDAWRKGIRGYDANESWKAIRKTTMDPGDKRKLFPQYAELGYVPGGLSETLEYAYMDACAAWFAQEMKAPEDAAILWKRALNYRNLFDPKENWLRARNADGTWPEWKGRLVYKQGTTESNPYQQGWFVPQDIPGFVKLFGKERFISDLTEFFEKTPQNMMWNDYYNHSNEPVHLVPFMAVYAGQPWITQRWTRAVIDRAYKTGPNGLVGNEDVGQMSAWYVLAALGLHPACPGDPVYVITSPLFPKATLRLDSAYAKGKTFSVTATPSEPGAIYIQSAKLNGKPIDRAWITHDEITAGGTLELKLGSNPNVNWGTSSLPPTLVSRQTVPDAK